MVELHINNSQLYIDIHQTNLDMASIDEVRSRIFSLQHASYDLVRVDLSKVEFIDSTGLGLLLTLGRLLTCKNRHVVLVNPRKVVVDILDTFRLLRAFEIEEVPASAIAR